jgi:hypothetical protein
MTGKAGMKEAAVIVNTHEVIGGSGITVDIVVSQQNPSRRGIEMGCRYDKSV